MTDNDAESGKSIGDGSLPFRLCILLAEDELDHQRLISFILRRAGADVITVENGQSAVVCALQAQEEGNAFDLILMDNQMPVMDGCMATRQLREAGYRLPIVAVTASAMTGDREKFIAAGCNDYISKPIAAHKLVDLVKRWADGSRIAGFGEAGCDGPVLTIRAAERQE